MHERLLITLVAAATLVVVLSLMKRRQTLAANRASRQMEKRTNMPTIVYFWSNGCPVCKMVQRPILERVLAEYGNERVTLIAYSVDKEPELTRKWGVMTLPTTFVLDSDGTIRHVNNGLVSPQNLRKQLQPMIISLSNDRRTSRLFHKEKPLKIESLKLVYFSPTGTTKKIVESIAKGITNDPVETLDITTPEGRKDRLQAGCADLLVIGAPVYFGRVQIQAAEWLKTIEAHDTPVVCVVVYGNRNYDDALLELKELIVGKGCVPIACAAYIGEHSFSNLGAPIAVGRPDSDDLTHAELLGRKITERVSSVVEVNDFTDIIVPGNFPYVDMIDGRKRLSSVDFIHVDNTCSQCGVCAQVCPVGAINPEDSASIDTRKCILCYACIKSCPENARAVKDDMIKNIALRLSQSCHARKEPVFFM